MAECSPRVLYLWQGVRVAQRHRDKFPGGNRICIVDLTHTDEICKVMHGRSQLDGSKGKLRVSEGSI